MKKPNLQEQEERGDGPLRPEVEVARTGPATCPRCSGTGHPDALDEAMSHTACSGCVGLAATTDTAEVTK